MAVASVLFALLLQINAALPAGAGDLATPVSIAQPGGGIAITPGVQTGTVNGGAAGGGSGHLLANKASFFAPKAPAFQPQAARAPAEVEDRPVEATFQIKAETLSNPAGEASQAWADENFLKLNEMSFGRKVQKAAGFHPEREPGSLLSSPAKSNTRVVRVRPESGPFKTAVVKTASADIVRREILTRRILEDFPAFIEQFETPAAAAYTAGLFSQRGVMVMADREAPHAVELTAAQRGALAVLTYGLGISDLNSDGVRQGTNGKVLLFDFEGALTPLRPGMNPAALSDAMSHVNRGHLNLLSDYQPAINAWKDWLSDPAVRSRIGEHFRLSGFSGRETRRALQTLDGNAALMESLIADGAASANQTFYAAARSAGLTDAQAREMSDFNRRAIENAEGPAELQKTRHYLRGHGKEAQRWRLWPERGRVLTAAEWADWIHSRPH